MSRRAATTTKHAEAICEAMSRPRVRSPLVPVKSVEQSASQMLMGVRDSLLKRRTQLCNTIRGHAAEFGLVAAKGLDKIEPLLSRIAAHDGLPALAREMFADLCHEHAELSSGCTDRRKLATFHRSTSSAALTDPYRRPSPPADHHHHPRASAPPLCAPLCSPDHSTARSARASPCLTLSACCRVATALSSRSRVASRPLRSRRAALARRPLRLALANKTVRIAWS